MYGPKGVGALYVRKPCRIAPLIDGGGHEGGLRSGTLNVPGIVGLAKAVELATRARRPRTSRTHAALRDRLWQALRDGVPRRAAERPALPADADRRLPNNLNVSLPAAAGEALLEALVVGGASRRVRPAPAPLVKRRTCSTALGRPAGLVNLRISVGRQTTDAEIDYVVACIQRAAVAA